MARLSSTVIFLSSAPRHHVNRNAHRSDPVDGPQTLDVDARADRIAARTMGASARPAGPNAGASLFETAKAMSEAPIR